MGSRYDVSPLVVDKCSAKYVTAHVLMSRGDTVAMVMSPDKLMAVREGSFALAVEYEN